MIIFFKLLLSHILCNFFIQSNFSTKNKKTKKFHIFIKVILFAVVSWLLVAEKPFVWYAIMLGIAFGIIEFLILNYEKPTTKYKYFIISQIVSIIIIALITAIYSKYTIDINFFNIKFWTVLTSILFLSNPSSKIINSLLNIWFCNNAHYKDNSLSRAGHYIGVLERLFILSFILTNHFEAIGFLLATKSIFRFGEFKDETYRELTEYYFIGTLLSFGIALLTGLLVQFGLLHFF